MKFSAILSKSVLAGLFAIIGSVLGIITAAAGMSPAQVAIFNNYMAAAKAADPAFKGASAARGKTFFYARQTGGKPELNTCTTCHTKDLNKLGQTRAGKDIEPMAASVSPKRYADPKKVAKWFRRNCSDVLGRECTAAEKVDVLAYLLSI